MPIDKISDAVPVVEGEQPAIIEKIVTPVPVIEELPTIVDEVVIP